MIARLALSSRNMLAIIPALDFLRSLSGDHSSDESAARLRVWKCGYGVAIDLDDGEKSQWVGVMGAHGSGVECFAHVGRPNVLRFRGDLTTKNALRFECDDLPFVVTIAREPASIHVAITLHGEQKAAPLFQAA